MSTKQQTIEHYTLKIANRFVQLFDVYRDDALGDIPLAFKALYKRRDEKYLITKSIKVWGVENQQCVFVAARDSSLTKAYIQTFKEELVKSVNRYVPQDREHMSTIFLGVVVTDQPVPSELVKEVRRFRKLKFVHFGWHGWVEIYLAIVDLPKHEVHIHPKGESFIVPFKNELNEEG